MVKPTRKDVVQTFVKFILGLSFKPPMKGKSNCTRKDVVWCMTNYALKSYKKNNALQKSITINAVEPLRGGNIPIISSFVKDPKMTKT